MVGKVPSHTISVLSYDATKWAHPGFRIPLYHPIGHPLADETGVLGTYRFENTARNTGRDWLMDSLTEVRGWPRAESLPLETGPNDPPPGVWRRCPWVVGQEKGGSGSWVYVVSDLESALSVRVTDEEEDDGRTDPSEIDTWWDRAPDCSTHVQVRDASRTCEVSGISITLSVLASLPSSSRTNIGLGVTPSKY